MDEVAIYNLEIMEIISFGVDFKKLLKREKLGIDVSLFRDISNIRKFIGTNLPFYVYNSRPTYRCMWFCRGSTKVYWDESLLATSNRRRRVCVYTQITIELDRKKATTFTIKHRNNMADIL